MGMSSSDMAAMYTLLMNSMSGDEGVRKQAEKALSETDSRSGFCSCLLELITSPDLVSQADIRLMASVYLKNSINRYWRSNTRRTIPNIWSSHPVLFLCFLLFLTTFASSHSYGVSLRVSVELTMMRRHISGRSSCPTWENQITRYELFFTLLFVSRLRWRKVKNNA